MTWFLKLYPSCLGVCSSICQLGSDYFYCIFTNMLVLPKLSSADMAEESWWSLRINPQSEAFGRRWEFRSCSYMHWWSVCVTALTHVCWPNSCNNLRHDCPPLFISAAEGMCPYISVSLVQSTAVRRKYFHPLYTFICQNESWDSRGIWRADFSQLCSQAASPGRERWGEQLVRAVASAVTGTLARTPQSKPFRSFRFWRMVNALKEKKWIGLSKIVKLPQQSRRKHSCAVPPEHWTDVNNAGFIA